ncbi:(3R)-hydroxyacyl-ACP dehydratase subunit HadC [Mycobacterium sp. pUA109]|uniref:(3R)-hydroxyacyl-ACP dehydratase subunit HadC n=1 Tax=Mycobacterium sp. pUA109 TaxID=3238982 RepID=UPI00351AC175
MALKTDIRGMVWQYPDLYVAGREQIREYARAVKSGDPASFDEQAAAALGYHAVVAPLTFACKFAFLIQQDFLRHVDIGMETLQILHVDQKFLYHRPILAGDALRGTLYIHSVDERFGADIVVTRSECTDSSGAPVLEAFTTMIGQQVDMSAHLRWDPVSAQHLRAPD